MTALRAAFPGAKVHIRYYDPRAGFADFSVSQPVTVTDARELLSMTTSWAPRRLRVTAEVLNACEHEAAITALVTAAVPKMERGVTVEIGIERPEANPRPDTDPAHGVAAEPTAVQRGPRLGRRVPAEELQRLLRKRSLRKM